MGMTVKEFLFTNEWEMVAVNVKDKKLYIYDNGDKIPERILEMKVHSYMIISDGRLELYIA